MTGLKVTAIKIDPYMNIDAGTMNPLEHGASCDSILATFSPRLITRATGEVYVLNDGGEVDLDLGNYERYLNITLSRDNNITTGKIYREVIENEVRLSLCSVIVLLTLDCSAVVIISARRSRYCLGLAPPAFVRLTRTF